VVEFCDCQVSFRGKSAIFLEEFRRLIRNLLVFRDHSLYHLHRLWDVRMNTRPKLGEFLSLYVIDDHPIVGLGLSMALQGRRHFTFLGSGSNRLIALKALETLRPNILIVDLVYDGEVQLGFIQECRTILPEALVVVFSSLPRHGYERETLSAGADAFVNKSVDIDTLIDLVSAMAHAPRNDIRNEQLSGDVGMKIDGVHLTRRESEVAQRLSRGVSIAKIAEDLSISANTVAVHRDNIRKKLLCRNMTELVALLARMEHKSDD
jgi:two-component system NarL family response regulator